MGLSAEVCESFVRDCINVKALQRLAAAIDARLVALDAKSKAQADHVVPVSQGGDRYDVANGQCLCIACHGRKTRGEQLSAVRCESQPTPMAAPRAEVWPEYR